MKQILFSGDITESTWIEYFDIMKKFELNMTADIYKVCHHGGSGNFEDVFMSTSGDIYDNRNIAVISSGYRKGLPQQTTLKNTFKYDFIPYCTQLGFNCIPDLPNYDFVNKSPNRYIYDFLRKSLESGDEFDDRACLQELLKKQKICWGNISIVLDNTNIYHVEGDRYRMCSNFINTKYDKTQFNIYLDDLNHVKNSRRSRRYNINSDNISLPLNQFTARIMGISEHKFKIRDGSFYGLSLVVDQKINIKNNDVVTLNIFYPQLNKEVTITGKSLQEISTHDVDKQNMVFRIAFNDDHLDRDDKNVEHRSRKYFEEYCKKTELFNPSIGSD